MRPMCILILLAIFFNAAMAQGAPWWRPDRFVVFPSGYGGGGRFTAVEVDPREAATVLVGSDVAGVFKSCDGGKNFQLQGADLEGFAVADIAFHPRARQTVFLLTDDGLYNSTDHGRRWRKLSSKIRYTARFFGSRLMLFTAEHLWIATNNRGIYRAALDAPEFSARRVPGLGRVKINGLAYYRKALYAATSRGVYRYAEGRWRPWNSGLALGRINIMDIAAHPEKSLYIVEKKSGLYRWNENQQRWEHHMPDRFQTLQHPPEAYKALAVHPEDPDRVLLASHPDYWPHVLLATSDGGQSWQELTAFQHDPEASENWPSAESMTGIEEISFAPSDPESIFITDWWNLWHSSNGGTSWQQRHRGLQNTVVYDIKVHPADVRSLYMAVADNGLMVSRDAGKTWKRNMAGMVDGHAVEIEFSRQNPDTMYVLLNAWHTGERVFVYRTRDGGRSWQEAGFAVPADTLPEAGYVSGLATNIEVDPEADGTVYVGTNGYGIYKTTDGGNSWRPANRGLATPYIAAPNALLIHPQHGNIIFASTQRGGVYKTINGGDLWKPVSPGHPFTFGMALDPSRLLVCCPGKKVIISSDAGRTWRESKLPGDRPDHIAAYSAAFHPRRPEIVFVGTHGYDCRAGDGLFISRDYGLTFEKVPLGLPAVSINDIVVMDAPGLHMLLGFNGTGVFTGRMQ